MTSEERRRQRAEWRANEYARREHETERVQTVMSSLPGGMYVDVRCMFADQTRSDNPDAWHYKLSLAGPDNLILALAIRPEDFLRVIGTIIPAWLNFPAGLPGMENVPTELDLLRQCQPDDSGAHGGVTYMADRGWFRCGVFSNTGYDPPTLITWPKYFMPDGMQVARRDQVALMVPGAHPLDLADIEPDIVRIHWSSDIPADVLEALMRPSGTSAFWSVRDDRGTIRLYFDDPEFGDPVDVQNLRYDSRMGLHVTGGFA